MEDQMQEMYIKLDYALHTKGIIGHCYLKCVFSSTYISRKQVALIWCKFGITFNDFYAIYSF